MPVTKITSFSQFQSIIHADSLHKPIIIDFFSTWCIPCVITSPLFYSLSTSTSAQSNLDFYELDVSLDPQIAMEVDIRMTPTFIVFWKGGKWGEKVKGVDFTALRTLVYGIIDASAAKMTVALK